MKIYLQINQMKIAQIEPPGLHSFEPIALEYLLPKTAENKHLYSNGVSRLIPRLTLKVHTDIESCYVLWNKFSQNKTLFDLWDFRYAWLRGYGYQQYFYTLYEGKKALGTLPLWYNEAERYYEWIGGYWMEGNSFFTEDDKIIDLLLAAVPIPIKLMSIEKSQYLRARHTAGDFKPEQDLKYTKNIADITSLDQLLSGIRKKSRYNFKADFRRIQSYNPRTEFVTDQTSPLEELFALNLVRFDSVNKEESIYRDPLQCNAFRETVKTGMDPKASYSVKFLRTTIENKVAAVDLLITHKDTYYQICGSNDVGHYNGVGNYMVYLELEDAINNRYGVVDCLQEDHSWKHRFFDSRQMYAFEK
jgi:hypothetical protein